MPLTNESCPGNQSWNSLNITGMSDLAILFKETVNTDEQASRFVTNALSSLDVKEHPSMTDYSTAIIGLIAFTAIVSAAVVYVLAQPSDLPVVKKDKAVKG